MFPNIVPQKIQNEIEDDLRIPTDAIIPSLEDIVNLSMFNK
jgi:hypothetical protein